MGLVRFGSDSPDNYPQPTLIHNFRSYLVEILSPSNSQKEMKKKREFYFDRGAKEVGLCDGDGKMKFYCHSKLLRASAIFSAFPKAI